MNFYKKVTGEIYSSSKPETEECVLVSREVAIAYSEARSEALRNSTSFRIKELKAKLAATDFKVLPDYDKPLPEGLLADRLAWREEIRTLEETL